MLNKSPFFVQHDHSLSAKALPPKYPEVGLPSPKRPIIFDPHLRVEVVVRGLRYPTSMAFLGPNDILVTEKDAGTVRRVVNNTELQQPLLNVTVATFAHRGLLGIAVDPFSKTATSYTNRGDHNSTTAYVFLYYTQAQTHAGDDITEGKQPLGNRVYRYELIDNKLVNPKMLLDLPATPGAIGNGGKVIVGPDKEVYITIGDVGINGHNTKAQNIQNGSEPDGTSGILRVNQDGHPVPPGILGDKYPLNLYYSYGIWNSFGLAFDPITRILWDTQIGILFGDKINRVDPGFNSGYSKIDGIWLHGYSLEQTEKQHIAPPHPNNLVYFGGKGKYYSPQFTWFRKVVPTGITFMNSNKIGAQYKNDMFVADDLNGNIYHFKLNSQRTGLLLASGPLADGVANSNDSLTQIIFGKGFGGITDLKVSPYDGNLYVLTFDQGTIYRIAPVSN
ncbi:MAG TPA: PQQ-dependent sugar dehydrogenase [Nitrososphaeraceae archaeon]|nr:PQQ-dependent sugar dehydrogenase [Nitrososphaeraceae archaeon]